MSRKLSTQLGVLGSGVLIGFVLRMLQSAVVARLLGLTEFGKYATVVALMAIVSRVNDLGLPNTVAYYFRRSRGAFGSLIRVIYLNALWCWVASLAVAFAVPHLPLAVGRGPSGVLLARTSPGRVHRSEYSDLDSSSVP